MTENNDITILRDLAKRYLEICNKDVQETRRDLWRKHNSFQHPKPLIYIRAFAWSEMEESKLFCQDPLFRGIENTLRQSLFRDTFEDDFIFEPWVNVDAVKVMPPEGPWGLAVEWSERSEPTGSRVWDSPMKEPEDFAKMWSPHHEIDKEATERRLSKVQDALGDIITINLDRSPIYTMWNGDISTLLAKLRGLEQIMWDMMDRPDWLHEVLGFMRDGIIRTHEQAEAAGDWSLSAHQNQCMPYALELPDPAANSGPVKRKDLWYFSASQETTLVGPKLWYEFMYQYQMDIMKHFGLTAYGCCEDLTHKIPYIKELPNIRRISVALLSDVEISAKHIGTDYIYSYRPSPTDMVGYGLDEDRVRKIMGHAFEVSKDLHVDVTLKDVETVQGDPNRIRNWVKLARTIIDEYWD